MRAGRLVQVGEQLLTTGQRGLRAEGRCRERRDAAAESHGVWQTLAFRQSDRKARGKRVAGTCCVNPCDLQLRNPLFPGLPDKQIASPGFDNDRAHATRNQGACGLASRRLVVNANARQCLDLQVGSLRDPTSQCWLGGPQADRPRRA